MLTEFTEKAKLNITSDFLAVLENEFPNYTIKCDPNSSLHWSVSYYFHDNDTGKRDNDRTITFTENQLEDWNSGYASMDIIDILKQELL